MAAERETRLFTVCEEARSIRDTPERRLNPTLHFAVIGAGPMGLAAAHRLTESGHRVTLIEADDRIGGMSAAFDFDGLPLERYYHFVCKTDQPLFDVLAQFGLEDKLRWKTTEMGFYYQGRWYDWGKPGALLTFPHLTLVDKIRFALHVLTTKAITDWRALDKVQATTWIRKWLGERGYKVLWEKLFELKFFEHQHEVSAAWIGTRIKRVALSRRNLFQEEMGYLEGGSQVLLDAYRARLLAAGAEIRLSSRVRRIVTEQGRVTGVDTASGLVQADRVLSTVPLRYVSKMLPELSAEECRRIDAIENIGVACVLLKLRKPATRYFWMNVNDERIQVPGFIEYSNLNPLRESVVYVPYYMPKTHPKWAWDDQRLLDEARDYFLLTQPHLTAQDIVARHVSRYEFAQAVCPPGFYERLPGMATSVEGFFMADTAYYYPEDRSIAESIRVGSQLADLAKT
jgi:protoporphyrinogen oxidase